MSYENLLRILFTPYLISFYLWVILPRFDWKVLLLVRHIKNLGSRVWVLPLVYMSYKLVSSPFSILQVGTTSWYLSSGSEAIPVFENTFLPDCLDVSPLSSYSFLNLRFKTFSLIEFKCWIIWTSLAATECGDPQEQEPKIPDRIGILVWWIVWVLTRVIVTLSRISIREADL